MKDLTERKHFTGIVKLSGGKAEPFLSLPKAAAEKGYTVPNYQPFTAGGHSLVLPAGSGVGTTVVNLRTRQAWSVKEPKGLEVGAAAASDGRLVWSLTKGVDYDHLPSRQVSIADVDRGTVRTTMAAKGAYQVALSGRGVAWNYGLAEEPGASYQTQSILLNE